MKEREIVSARGISKCYPGGVTALDGVDLTIAGGDRFVLLGPNGAGKSTLVRILCSLSRVDAGRCTVCGIDPERDARRLMSSVGLVTQENDLDPEASPEDLLRFQCRLFGMDRRQSGVRASTLIEMLDLGDHAAKRVRELSGGNKRKLHCALALVHQPRILFLDEPTVGMDPEVRARFWEVIRGVNREEGTTLFLTTQYLEEADRHADQLAMLRDGRIQYRGTVAEFKAGVPGTASATSAPGAFVPPDPTQSLEAGYLAYLADRSTQNPTQEMQEITHGTD